MKTLIGRFVVAAAAVVVVATGHAAAQVGKSLGVVDVNTITEADLLKVPHITPAAAKAILAARPFQSVVELNTLLRGQGLTDQQTAEVYGRIFVHINLNTATAQEIMLIPGAGKRMAHEFEEYRPWKAWAQFDKEIGKYVNAQEVARLAQYGFIPINLNTASDADLSTIPGVGQRMLHELKEYRPWKTREQFDREIGKYVNQKEVARLARYVVIP
jgi:DNA uptake protein ComE-like DNA-binding protein